MSIAILPLAIWPEGINQASIPANDNAWRVEILNGKVISQAVTAQPGAPAEGAIYIIPAAATGAQWALFTAKDMAIYKGGTWHAYAPVEGVVVNVAGTLYKYESGAWVAVGGGGGTAWADLTGVPATVDNIGDLVDPAADRLLFWDDSAGALVYLTLGTNLSITGTTIDAAGGAADAEDVAYDNAGSGLTATDVQAALDELAGGAGTLSNWTEAVSIATPNATVPVVSFAVTNAATDVDAVLKPKGTGGVLAAIPNNTATGGNKRGQNAVDLQTKRSVNTQVASNTTCVIAGGDSNTASGTYSAVLGGQTNIASGPFSAVGGGKTNTASAYGASVMGGEANTANTGDYACVAGGYTNTATGFYAHVTGGTGNTASGDMSRAGGNLGTTRGIRGADVFGSGLANSQGGRYLVRCSTTDATPKVLTASGAAASTALIVTMPNTTVFAFSALVTAKRTAGTDGAGWKIEGVVIRGASAATVAFIGTPTVTALGATAGAAAWAAAAVVDTTNGGFTIQATGQAATTITWLASISTAET